MDISHSVRNYTKSHAGLQKRTIGFVVAGCLLIIVIVIVTWRLTESTQLAAITKNAILMRSVIGGLSAFDGINKQLPAAITRSNNGQALSSWRFKIMNYLQSWPGECDFDKAWDAPVNAWAAQLKPMTYYCFPTGQSYPILEGRMTNILAVTGPGTAFEEGKIRRFNAIPKNTIILIETRRSDLHWMQPGDLDLITLRQNADLGGSGILGTTERGFLVGFADGSVWLMDNRTPSRDIALFCTLDGAEHNDREQALGKYKLYSIDGFRPAGSKTMIDDKPILRNGLNGPVE